MTDVAHPFLDVCNSLLTANSGFSYTLDNNSGITIVGEYLDEGVYDIDIKYDREGYEYDLKNLLLSLCCITDTIIAKDYLVKCIGFIELISSCRPYLEEFRHFIIEDKKDYIGISKLNKFTGIQAEKTLYKKEFRWNMKGAGIGNITIDSNLLNFNIPNSFDLADIWYAGKLVEISDCFLIHESIKAVKGKGIIKVIDDDIVLVPEIEPSNILESFKISIPKCLWYKFYPVVNIVTYG